MSDSAAAVEPGSWCEDSGSCLFHMLLPQVGGRMLAAGGRHATSAVTCQSSIIVRLEQYVSLYSTVGGTSENSAIHVPFQTGYRMVHQHFTFARLINKGILGLNL
jgi:hypothetical protein